jgi:hypothetical protein
MILNFLILFKTFHKFNGRINGFKILFINIYIVFLCDYVLNYF